ncbi:MAG: type II 3-dehydroquinate dehydratase [Chitinophagaceae bacterium]
MTLAIINGPNLNLLGKREVDIYGNQSFDLFLETLKTKHPGITFSYYQSNIEGELVNYIQEAGFSVDGIILNPAAYTHTSVALGDAIAAVKSPVVEVHISNTAAREEFRHISHVSAKCAGTIIGLGLKGYELAIEYFLSK